jgi:hypothetical protein
MAWQSRAANARKNAKKNTNAMEKAIEKAGCSLWSSRL